MTKAGGGGGDYLACRDPSLSTDSDANILAAPSLCRTPSGTNKTGMRLAVPSHLKTAVPIQYRNRICMKGVFLALLIRVKVAVELRLGDPDGTSDLAQRLLLDPHFINLRFLYLCHTRSSFTTLTHRLLAIAKVANQLGERGHRLLCPSPAIDHIKNFFEKTILPPLRLGGLRLLDEALVGWEILDFAWNDFIENFRGCLLGFLCRSNLLGGGGSTIYRGHTLYFSPN